MAGIDTCLIVAAGKGTRFKGIGDLRPLVNLCGKPLIEHAMVTATSSGVTNFVIVVGYKAKVLSNFLQTLKSKYPWEITIVENTDYEKSNGVSVLSAEPYLRDEFFFVMCDHVVDAAIYEHLQSTTLPRGAVGLGVDRRLNNTDVDVNDVTKVWTLDDKVQNIGKAIEKYNAYDVGIFRANPNFFSAIRKSLDATGDCSISGGMRELAKEDKAIAIDIGNARWIDVDSPDMHRRAHAWKHEVLEHRTVSKSDNKIVAVGHRGTKKFAPENTIAAHEVAFALGARAIEFDVRCTKDGHFILIHDATVNRTTDGIGRVKDLTLSQIRELDAGIGKGPEFVGEKVPTLREALRNVKGRFVVDIDFKGGPANSADILANVLEEEGFSTGHLVTIFARRHHFKLLNSLCPQYALRPHYISQRKTRFLAKTQPLEVMGLRRLSFSQKAARSITSSNLHLFCNVMGKYDNEVGFEDAINAGARFIQTDNLDLLIPYLEKRGLLETCVLGRDYQPIQLMGAKMTRDFTPGLNAPS